MELEELAKELRATQSWCALFKDGLDSDEYVIKGDCLTVKSVDFYNATVVPDCLKKCGFIKRVKFAKSVQIIDSRAFKEFNSLVSVEFSESQVVIGDEAFAGCETLREVKFPSVPIVISRGAFSNCPQLKEVKVPFLTSLEMCAFRNCFSLENVVIGGKFDVIGEACFKNCSKLRFASFESVKGLYFVDVEAFHSCSSLEQIEGLEGVTGVGVEAFKGCRVLREVKFPSLSTAQNGSFEDCTSLEEIEFDDHQMWTYKQSFKNCTSLKRVKFGKSLTEINAWAFNGCTSLESVELPECVRKLSTSFKTCTSLRTVRINSRVLGMTIDGYAFNHCKSLERIEAPTSLGIPHSKAFRGTPLGAKLVFYETGVEFPLYLVESLVERVESIGLRPETLYECLLTYYPEEVVVSSYENDKELLEETSLF